MYSSASTTCILYWPSSFWVRIRRVASKYIDEKKMRRPTGDACTSPAEAMVVPTQLARTARTGLRSGYPIPKKPCIIIVTSGAYPLRISIKETER